MKKFRIYAGGKELTVEADCYKQVGCEIVFYKDNAAVGQVVMDKGDVVMEASAVKDFATF
jgi:hypothetical protein